MLRIHQLVVCALVFASSTLSLTYKGADISSVIEVENKVSYKDTNGAAGKMEVILKNHGMNTARVRVWTGGIYQQNFALALGKRIKAAGLTLIVDLHYSDVWADPGHQATPSSWGNTVAQLNTNIYTYTKNIVTAFAAQGTPIDILQIGNEINNGFLWPTAKASNFDAMSQYLHSARQGARDAGFGGKAMIHLADGWDVGTMTWWFDSIFRPGQFSTADVDIIGVSFYPFYNKGATLANLKSSLTTVVNKYGKDVMVAETDWPAVPCSVQLTGPYAHTAAGQNDWIGAITGVLNGLPNGRGKGILYWEPGWVGNSGLGSACSDNILFETSGKARVSVDMFKRM